MQLWSWPGLPQQGETELIALVHTQLRQLLLETSARVNVAEPVLRAFLQVDLSTHC